MRNQRAFTLIEILIAIGILSAITITCITMMNNVISSKSDTEIRVGAQQAAHVGIAKITDDLRMAFLSDTKFHGKESAFLSGFVGSEQSMHFSTLSGIHTIKNHRDTDQIQVGYELKRDRDGFTSLARRQTDYLTGKLEEGGSRFILIPRVESFTLEYYDSNKKEWTLKWDTDSVSYAGRLPKMVKIKLIVLGELESEDDDTKRKPYAYEVVVPLALYKSKISF